MPQETAASGEPNVLTLGSPLQYVGSFSAKLKKNISY